MTNHHTYYYSNKITVLFVLFLLLTSTLLAQTKIQSGSWSISPSLENYSLDKGDEERSMIIEIKFEETFKSKPGIFLSVSQIDASNKANIRYNVEAMSVLRDGFTLKVKTWADTKIYSISGYWVAFTQ